MTGLSEAHAGRPNPRRADRFFAATNRLRSEGTDHLLAAAEAAGVTNFVAQSAGIFNGIREGGWVKTEDDPLEVVAGTKAISHLEDVVVKAGGTVLRYGSLYGPGAIDDQVTLVRRRLFPLVGGGTGYFSWVHLDDAASAASRRSRRRWGGPRRRAASSRCGRAATWMRAGGDGGGKAPAVTRTIIGAKKVARLLVSFAPGLVRMDVTVEPHEVNGQPGAVFRDRDSRVLFTWALDVLEGQIQAVRSVSNPDKLRHVGPVTDAQALAREASQARRTAD